MSEQQERHVIPQDHEQNSGLKAIFAVLAFCVFAVSAYQWSIANLDTFNDLPGTQHDDVFFDNLALNLSRGDGFQLSFSDPDWYDVYAEANDDGRYDWVLNYQADGPTTARPPGFPFVLSVCYRLFGREWTRIRTLNIFVLALGLTFLVTTVRKYTGWLAAILATGFLAADYFIMSKAGEVMTEPMATGLTAIFFAMLVRTWNQRVEFEKQGWRWFGVGLLFGVCILFRSNFVAWLAQIVVLCGLTFLYLLIRRAGATRFLHAFTLFMFGCLIVAAPWWARNCWVSQEFSPLGCGARGLIGGYCDASYENNGNWIPRSLQKTTDEVTSSLNELEHSPLSLAQVQMIVARASKEKAWQWSHENQEKIPSLFLMRAQTHLLLSNNLAPWVIVVNCLLLFGMLVGCFFKWKTIGFWLLLIVFLSIATTILTWAHFGRYSIPVRPMIHCGAAIGTVYFWAAVFASRSSQ